MSAKLVRHRLAVASVTALALSLLAPFAMRVAVAQTATPAPKPSHHAAAAPAHKAARSAATSGAWTTYHHDDGHTGYDGTQPAALTATAGWTSPALDDRVYVEPLVYNGIVYVATLNNTVFALNQADGTVIWSTSLRAPQTTGWTCGNVSPQGILGTPVVDPATGRIYVVTLDSGGVYRVEGLDLARGNVSLSTILTTSAPGFDWRIQQQRGALAVHNGYVYVPVGGRFGDCGTYHGYIFAVPTNGAAALPPYVTPGAGAGFWGAGGVVVDDSTGKVFDTSGNGVASGCDANPDGTPTYENDAVVGLSPTLAHLSSFVPPDWQANWCTNDQDLGSASMVLINPTLAFQAGKWGNGFLVNPQALGGMNGQLYPARVPYTGVDVCLGNHSDANFGSYAYAAPFVYLSCDANGAFTGRMVGLKVDTAAPSFSACDSTCAAPSWNAGSSTYGPPIVAGGAVWAIDSSGGGLSGWDAATGRQLYQSAAFGATHFSTPSEAGGQIFVGADNTVMSFNMVFGCQSVTDTAQPQSPAEVGTAIAFTAVASGCPNPNPVYEFWLLAPGAGAYTKVQPYSTNQTFNWRTIGLTPGTYRVSVRARDANSAGAYGNSSGTWDAYYAGLTFTLTGCAGVAESASPPTAAMHGMTVTITAAPSGCTSPMYAFWLLAPGGSNYVLKRTYNSSTTFSWPTTGLATGTYRITVWIRDTNSAGAFGNGSGTWDEYASLAYQLTAGCPSVSDSASPPSPAAVGTPVTITARAPGCPNPLYEFWVLAPGGSTYSLKQDYGNGSPTFNWSTIGLAKGTYRISVWARDASSPGVYFNSSGRWDAYNANLVYRLT